jgi:hypothetical protein
MKCSFTGDSEHTLNYNSAKLWFPYFGHYLIVELGEANKWLFALWPPGPVDLKMGRPTRLRSVPFRVSLHQLYFTEQP